MSDTPDTHAQGDAPGDAPGDAQNRDAQNAAARLVADLMPIAVAVCGPGAGVFATWLEEAGAAAEVFAPDDPATFDLAVLLATAEPPNAAQHGPVIAGLAAASDRLLFVPVPLGQSSAPHLNAWFELFADQGYQPVVEYDAGFLGAGAFLVDRNATAAEDELAAFADRVSGAADAPAPPPPPPAVAAPAPQIAAASSLEADLAVSRAETASWRARAERAETEAENLRREIGAWDAIGRWVWAACAKPERDMAAPRRAWLARWRRPARAEQQQRADAALIRQSRHFDAAWYIATHPDLAETGDDPVWHYVRVGAAAGAEPGPHFDSRPWRERYPGRNPCAEAIRQGKE
jgi:hypothetical protein